MIMDFELLTPYTLHLTPYTLHLTPYTLHLTPYTLHLTPYNLHLTPYTLHLTPYNLKLIYFIPRNNISQNILNRPVGAPAFPAYLNARSRDSRQYEQRQTALPVPVYQIWESPCLHRR